MSSSSSSAGKKRRMDAILSCPSVNVSVSDLARILKHVRANPSMLEESLCRKGIANKMKAAASCVESELQLQLESGETFDWPVHLPQKLMPVLAASGDPFGELLAIAKRAAPFSGGWSMIIYGDEITPGNVLRPDNARKTTAFYISFRDFGSWLRCEDAWLCIAVIRHNTAASARGGMSGVIRILLEAVFADMSVGIVIGDELFFCTCTNIIGDEAALKSFWGAKGSAGIKPCLPCKNVVMKDERSGLLCNDASGYLIDISEARVRNLDFATDDDIWWLCDQLLQHRGSKASLSQKEKAFGLRQCPFGLLAALPLREHVKPRSNTFDSMHCYFSQGIAGQELQLFLTAAEQEFGLKYEALDKYCKLQWKTQRDRKYTNTFSPQREAHPSDTFRGMASEVLYVYPLVEQFAATVIEPLCDAGLFKRKLDCFYTMCKIVRLLQRMKNNTVDMTAAAAELEELQQVPMF